MAAARTMQVGLLLAILGSARATCLKPGYDMGDSANSCGYAPEVKVFGGPGYDFSAHSWIASKGITTEAVGAAEDLDSATDCQALCLGAGADYFAYDPVALCVCKAEYAEASCYPLYAPYESSSAMIAGPASCGTCFRVDHDMGADFNGCGYAPEVKIFGGPGYDFSAHSWIASKGITTEAVGAAGDLDSATDCQELCFGAGAAYFAYEPDQLCVCKDPYEASNCTLFGERTNITAGPTVCQDCFRGSDMGADFNGCGYASEVKVFGGPGYDFSAHSWIASKGITTEAVGAADELDSAMDCQALCLGAGADYFAYEPGQLCVCKDGYSDASCVLYGLNAGAPDITSGPTQCPGCIMDGYDAAGSANICGYAVEVKIVATTGYDFSEPSWIATKGIPTAHTDNLRTPYDCRMLCMAETGCAFFAFDAMKQPGKGFCVLKQAYSHPSCEPQYGADDDIASGPLLCKSTIKCGMLDDACCD
ncbi:unnamed protein product [Prorocentrum cordatum]|uniref:EGF-like domain-containing protein n=1 Tax=Prorocentrum cordatum TaxID=2364126 RepID=A0ABN9XAQ6_9DINO|nr:unnamed protein product [Polarella glacialis]